MSGSLLAGLIPVRWLPPGNLPKYDQVVVVDWLEQEVDNSAPQRMPVLKALSGWRNREMYEYIKSYDWTARMYQC